MTEPKPVAEQDQEVYAHLLQRDFQDRHLKHQGLSFFFRHMHGQPSGTEKAENHSELRLSESPTGQKVLCSV